MGNRRRARLFSTTARIAAVSVAVFLLLSVVLSIQMASGHDPVLGPKQRALASDRRHKSHRRHKHEAPPRSRPHSTPPSPSTATPSIPAEQAPPPPPPPVVTQAS